VDSICANGLNIEATGDQESMEERLFLPKGQTWQPSMHRQIRKSGNMRSFATLWWANTHWEWSEC